MTRRMQPKTFLTNWTHQKDMINSWPLMKWLHPKVKLLGALEGLHARALWKSHLYKLKSVYIWGTLAVLLTTLAEVAVPHVVKNVIDLLSTSSSQLNILEIKNQFLIYFLFLLGLYALQYIGRIGWRVLIAQQAHHVGAQMKSLLWNRVRYLPKVKLDRDLRPGDLMNVATGDVSMGRFAYSFNLVMTADIVWLFTLTIGSMFWLSPKLTLWTLAIVPALPYFLHRLTLIEGKQHDIAQETLSEFSELSSQAVSTVRLQRLTQTGEYWKDRLYKSALRYLDDRRNVIFTGLKFIPLTGITPIISYIVLLFIGIPEVTNGHMTVGSFVALQSYIFLIQVPLIELGATIADWQRSFTSLHRITRVYNEAEAPRLRSGGEELSPSSSQLVAPIFEISNLNYSIPETNLSILKNLDLRLMPHERLGILGPVGSGKSTLINLLAGFDDNFDGQILFHSQPIQTLSHVTLRNRIAIVPQKSFLFADTIRNNIRLDQELSDEEIWHFLSIAEVDSDVKSFEKGLNTRIGEWGVTLSGGQKQRLTLARALARKPEVLLLDDCLSAVDTLTEEKILKSLDRELKKTTIVWVAHRRSTLKYCNHVLELNRER